MRSISSIVGTLKDRPVGVLMAVVSSGADRRWFLIPASMPSTEPSTRVPLMRRFVRQPAMDSSAAMAAS